MNPAADLNERELQREVIALARCLGFKAGHFADSRRQVVKGGRRVLVGDEQGAGIPDLLLVGRRRILFIELKTQSGTVTETQAAWLTVLSATARVTTGVEVYLWRPQHWLDGTIDKVLRRTR